MRLYHSIPLGLALSLTATDVALARPSSSSSQPQARNAPELSKKSSVAGHRRTGDPIHMPLRRRAAVQRNATEWGEWAKAQKTSLEAKYAAPGSAQRKRASGQNLCVYVFPSFQVMATVTPWTLPGIEELYFLTRNNILIYRHRDLHQAMTAFRSR